MNLVVFISGKGTTLQAIIDSINSTELVANITCVISNNPEASGLLIAKEHNIDTYIIEESVKMEQEILAVLEAYDIDLIILAGYLKLIGPELTKKYTIINTHPSLLPKYGGKGMYGIHVHQSVIDAKELESGATLHYVNEEYDKGAIIAQTKVPVLSTDDAYTLSSRVQLAEKRQLIEALNFFSQSKTVELVRKNKLN